MVNLFKLLKKIFSKIFRGGLDKMAKDVYVYYSGPTDDTGKRLAEALGAKHGKTKPTAKAGQSMIVVGWGCKTKEPVILRQHTVLNHPDSIRINRNKLETLRILKGAGVPVADFIEKNGIIAALDDARSAINIPTVGRTKFHQGGKGFWACLTKTQVQKAIADGAEYFQSYLDIKDEYRLHVFGGEVINMQKKVERNNMAAAYKEQHGSRIANVAEKAGVKLDKKTADYILENIGKRQERPDQIIKSNTRGWKFSQVKTVKKEMIEAAVNAVKAIGLDFGAVDCCLTADGNPFIIEVNTGPGLQGSSFDAYVAAFKKRIAEINKPAPKPADKTKPAAESKSKPAAKSATLAGKSVKETLAAKAALMSEMIEKADEEEARVLDNLLKKMWG